MALEIEAKIPVDSFETLRERLRTLGAENHGAAFERNMILDTAKESLREKDILFRLRTTGTKGGLLTVKRPTLSGEYKTREEIETFVDDAEAFLTQMEALGLSVRKIYEKRRETWKFSGCEICLDELPELGLFVEIEGSADRIDNAAAQLGLDTKRHINDNYLSLWDKYLAARGDKPRDMVFRGD